MLAFAIALVLQTYPNLECGKYTCGAYDICATIDENNMDTTEDIYLACMVVEEAE